MSAIGRRVFLGGFCSCSMLALAGCAPSAAPEGKVQPGYKPALSSEEAGLWQAVEKAEKDLKRSQFLLTDADLNDYVKSVFGRLAPDYANDVRIYLVRTPYFNANMAPNGMMQVWSGLLLRTQNEAQLAAILGHEFGHFRERHTLQRFRDARDKAGFAAFAGLGLGVASLPLSLALISDLYAFNRDQERQADEIGLELMAKAGYAPVQASNIWEQLLAEDAADHNRNQNQRNVLFATHPAPQERMTALREKAKSYPSSTDEVRADRHKAHLHRLRAVFIQDELRLRQYDRMLFVLKAIGDGWGEDGEVAFYTGEVYRLRGDSGDDSRARESYERAATFRDCPPEVYRALGLLHRKAGERAAADAAFRKYLDFRPDAVDREMISSYLSAEG